MITKEKVMTIIISILILYTIIISIFYVRISKYKQHINIIQKDSIVYNITILDSIKYNIQYRDSIVYNIKKETYEKIEEAYNLDDAATVELFEYLVSK